jgi:3'-phosphoadenosine 5'-phosphosulfate sulfotransferase (PAPS reductase)/FAD synthetase
MMNQLFDRMETRVSLGGYPDLREYDYVVVNTSAGKDSLAMMDRIDEIVRALDPSGTQRLREKVVAVHCDLGRVEWKGTPELAERQAASYGFRFVKVSRPQGDLIDQIRARGMFPSSAARYCTSDQKRGQVSKVHTALANEVREVKGNDYRARIINIMGLRAQESPARAKKAAFSFNKRESNGRREVHEWLPILDWTLTDVWTRIRERGLEYHKVYDAGLPRLSCVFCVLASKHALIKAAQLEPELAQTYVELEEEIGHTFQNGRSMREIVEEARNTTVTTVEDWSA